MATKTTAKTPKRAERLVRLNSEIPEELDNALRVYAATKRVSRKNVIEQALRTFLNPSSEDNRDAMIARRLQRIDQKLLTVVEGNKVSTETLGVFVQVALGLLPEPLTEAEKKEFADKVKRRFPRFIDLVTEVLAERSRGLYAHLPKQMVATPADFPEPQASQAANKESADDHQ
jgi:hypothetical protein